MIRGNVDLLMKLVGALNAAGIELIGEGAASPACGPAAYASRPEFGIGIVSHFLFGGDLVIAGRRG